MGQKQLKGVGGVLSNLISPEPPTVALPEPAAKPAPAALSPETPTPDSFDHPAPAATSEKPSRKAQGRIAARRGRPPGQRAGEAADKEKVTLRLNKEMMDDYREWSWEERCQLGELVERAMLQYRKHRDRQKSQ
jgi:uncharacterized protein (DUF4415 family)